MYTAAVFESCVGFTERSGQEKQNKNENAVTLLWFWSWNSRIPYTVPLAYCFYFPAPKQIFPD